jgi:uncharacterized protein
LKKIVTKELVAHRCLEGFRQEPVAPENWGVGLVDFKKIPSFPNFLTLKYGLSSKPSQTDRLMLNWERPNSMWDFAKAGSAVRSESDVSESNIVQLPGNKTNGVTMYRILSLDGGGVYGTIQAVLLERLCSAKPDFFDKIDLIAGTSIGGVIALSLAKPMPPTLIRGLFETHAKEVFAHGYVRMVASGIGLQARYTSKNLKKVLESYYGNTTLGDLKKHVLVPAFELSQVRAKNQQWRAKFFHNIPGPDSDAKTQTVDVAMATSAAPIFFPTYGNYLDGGLVENNPSACALAQTQDHRNQVPKPALEDIRLFSMGRNAVNHYLAGANHDYGWLRWMRPIVEICLDRDSTVVHYQMEKLLNQQYFRLAPTLDASLEQGIDNWEDVPGLVAFSNSIDLTPTLAWLKENW